MMLKNNISMALHSLRSARWRNFLTMLGIIIGVVSVVTVVSLGEGVKQQITNEISQRGENLITVLPGYQVDRKEDGTITGYNPLSAAGNVFTDDDLQVVRSVSKDAEVVPFGRITGVAETDELTMSAQIIASDGNLASVLNQPIRFGDFFRADESSREFAVIGAGVAEKLFGENAPVGKTFRIRDQQFIVRGVFERFSNDTPLLLTTNYDNAIFIPYGIGQQAMGGSSQIYQILVQPKDEQAVEATIKAINEALLVAHAGAEDFTVLRQSETLVLADNLLTVLTRMVAAVAAVSLLVGGIGIMNIMFVSVTERTREIGIRKSIGATNQQIMSQFLIEASVLSFVGGIIGIVLSFVVNILLRIFTDLQPVISLDIVLIASAVALVIGTLFGVVPAFRAARKDPIDALRG
jgi:putative ABC transport system permease protein